MSNIGARLKEERERLEMTQVEMAEAASVTRVSQQNYENDRRVPDAEYLGALHKLGVDILYVITGERKN